MLRKPYKATPCGQEGLVVTASWHGERTIFVPVLDPSWHEENEADGLSKFPNCLGKPNLIPETVDTGSCHSSLSGCSFMSPSFVRDMHYSVVWSPNH